MSDLPPSPSHCLPPVVDRNVRLLVLGSLPGARSLAATEYYAHPRNGFWPLMNTVTGAPLTDLPYDDRLRALLAARIGLWDVVARAVRRGSLDAAMREVAANPLPDLVASLPRIEAVAFNGATAARLGRRALGTIRLTLIDLPSSSPAFTLPLARKAEQWAVLKPFVDTPSSVAAPARR